ncbi:MAG: hypothetical protein LBE06_04920 [Azoarcus sp.]|jgi:hypothetical protein|nr:hypothetical protein [Azoarcus sp.]
MPSGNDWLPAREQDLIDLIAVWQVKLANQSLQTAYGWIASECTTTVAALTAFLTARATYQSTPTHPNRLAKDGAKKTAIAAMRKFAAERIRNNPKMTEAQRDELGVRTRDPVPTPVPVPAEGPESRIEISAHAPGQVKVYYEGAKPYGVIAVDIAYGVPDAPVERADDLPHRDSFTRNPWTYAAQSGERGKNFYYALRWRTNEGVSAWTEQSREVIIP